MFSTSVERDGRSLNDKVWKVGLLEEPIKGAAAKLKKVSI